MHVGQEVILKTLFLARGDFVLHARLRSVEILPGSLITLYGFIVSRARCTLKVETRGRGGRVTHGGSELGAACLLLLL